MALLKMMKERYEKVVLIGGILDEKNINDVKAHLVRFLPNSADIFQKNMISGLLQNGVHRIELVNSMYIGTYPRYCKKVYIAPMNTYYADMPSVPLHDTAFINLPIINKNSRFAAIKKAIRTRCAQDARILFIVYSLLPQNMKAISYIKEHYPNSETLLIITDLPQYMMLQNQSSVSISGIYHTIDNKLNQASIEHGLKDVDFFVLLSEHMADVLPKNRNNKTLIMEGLLDTDVFDHYRTQKQTHKKKRITYTGALEENLGITDLLLAFEKLNRRDVELYIAGDGTLKSEVEKATRTEGIHYVGSLDKEHAIELQLNSEVLVCPTKTGQGCSKYAFPAKLLEYLYTGNAVVSRKLECIPDEYHEYIVFAEDGTVDALASAIRKALDGEKYTKDQTEWIRQNKSLKGQMSRLINFVITEGRT